MYRAFSIFEQIKRIGHVIFSYFTLNTNSTYHGVNHLGIVETDMGLWGILLPNKICVFF